MPRRKPATTSMTSSRRGNGTGTMLPRKGKGAWRARYYDHDGRRVTRSTQTTDRRAAERILAQWIAEVALRRERVVDPGMDKIRQHTSRPLAQHLDDYEVHLAAKGRTARYVTDRRRKIEAGIAACGWSCVADIDRDQVDRYVVDMQDRGLAATTQASRVGALKGFTRWLHRTEKIARDPLVSVAKPSIAGKQTLRRRMLLPDEWPWLVDAAQNGPILYGLTGPERATLYAAAIQTALRASELASLTTGRMHTRALPPYVLVQGSDTKSSKRARQYITPKLADDLDALARHKTPGTPVWAMPQRTAVMVCDDLAAARANWINAAAHNPDEQRRRQHSDFLAKANADGEVFDFHALRHTAGAWLCMRGEQPKVVQEFMRHSTITLTMDTYGHLFPGQAAAAVRHFGDLMPTPDQPEAATGTTATVPVPPPAAPSVTGPHALTPGWDSSAHSQNAGPCGGERPSAPDTPNTDAIGLPANTAETVPNAPESPLALLHAGKSGAGGEPPGATSERTSNPLVLAGDIGVWGRGAVFLGESTGSGDSGAPIGASCGVEGPGAGTAGSGARKDGRPWVVQVAEAGEGLSAAEREAVLWLARFMGQSAGDDRRRRLVTVRQFLVDAKTKGGA